MGQNRSDNGNTADVGNKGESSFFDSKTIDQLQREQGIHQAQSLDELCALSPFADGDDELLQFILDERSERRKISRRMRLSL